MGSIVAGGYPGYLGHLILWSKSHWESVFALFRNKSDEIFLVKFFQKCRRLSWKIFPFLQWISGHPGEASYVYFLIFSKFLVRTSAALKIFGHSQIRSKTTKMTKSPQKSQNFANLSVLVKIIGLALHFDQFWAQLDQKKSTFWTFEKFWQLPIEIWPNPKSGPFGQIWALKIWSWSLFIK